MTKEKEIEAWHFLPESRCLRYDSKDVLVEPGNVYYIEKPPIMCQRGMHASVNALDAVNYAPGPIVCRVILWGNLIEGDDKLVAMNREVLWMADATDTLREFARWSALSVAHLWDMPDGVRRYLETGDESLRSATESAAESAAESAVWSAAGAAAWSAARSAAWSAARSATESAVESAVEAADSAAWSAAESAAESAAWSAAGAVTGAAVRSAQNEKLESMLRRLE